MIISEICSEFSKPRDRTEQAGLPFGLLDFVGLKLTTNLKYQTCSQVFGAAEPGGKIGRFLDHVTSLCRINLETSNILLSIEGASTWIILLLGI
jgi:hypothetical protein